MSGQRGDARACHFTVCFAFYNSPLWADAGVGCYRLVPTAEAAGPLTAWRL